MHWLDATDHPEDAVILIMVEDTTRRTMVAIIAAVMAAPIVVATIRTVELTIPTVDINRVEYQRVHNCIVNNIRFRLSMFVGYGYISMYDFYN